MPGSLVKKAAVPVSAPRLHNVGPRADDFMALMGAAEQFDPRSAPPAPDQRKSLLIQPMVNDIMHMDSLASHGAIPRRDHTMSSMPSDRLGSNHHPGSSSVGPPTRKSYYEVIVPTVESNMERPNWRPRRAVHAQFAQGGSESQADGESKNMSARKSTMSNEMWPPAHSRPVQVFIGSAKGLPKADRSGHSDPYAACQVLGKARSRVKTHVVGDTECPVFNEAFVVEGWNEGEPLDFSIFDHDLVGAHDQIASILLSSKQFYPGGFEGTVSLQNMWAPDGKVPAELKEFNLAQRPTLDVRVFVPPLEEGAERAPSLSEHPPINMPGSVPTSRNVCSDLDAFEARTRPVERLGNFWMSQPAKTARSSDGR